MRKFIFVSTACAILTVLGLFFVGAVAGRFEKSGSEVLDLSSYALSFSEEFDF